MSNSTHDSAELSNTMTDWQKTRLEELIAQATRRAELEGRIKSRYKLLNKLLRTYSRIPKPSKESPMDLSGKAAHYNEFVEDLYKFAEIEDKKTEKLKAQLTAQQQLDSSREGES